MIFFVLTDTKNIMGLFTKIHQRFLNENDKSNNSHIKNLILLSKANGGLGEHESSIIKTIAENLYMSNGSVYRISKHLKDIPFHIPLSEKRKFDQMYDLVFLLLLSNQSAGIETDESYMIIKMIALKYGFEINIINKIKCKIVESQFWKHRQLDNEKKVIQNQIRYN